MITIRKLNTLKPATLRRKTAVIIQAFEQDLIQGLRIDERYLAAFLMLTVSAFSDDESVGRRAEKLHSRLDMLSSQQLLRELNGLRHQILKVLGSEPADWDLSVSHAPVSRSDEAVVSAVARSIIEIYLDDLRSPFNIGSIFRTSEAFGVSRILLSPDCPSPEHPRAQRSSMGCTGIVPWGRVDKKDAFEGKTVFALELGGTALSGFRFPENGIAVIGSEELGISPEARKAAENSGGLISIPIFGKKGSINVSVAFGIMMQRWSESFSLKS
ncbi:MAG TPA: TrmH family RNA methyltransferase [Spirochaeta sp.]|nr:TrmH family RNA methyltransferase [Spirochaeta sp.]